MASPAAPKFLAIIIPAIILMIPSSAISRPSSWPSSRAFVVPPSSSSSSSSSVRRVARSPSSAALCAAASKKKKKRVEGGGGGGGFGSSSSSTTTTTGGRRRSEDDDVVVYPDLDPRVVETLVPYDGPVVGGTSSSSSSSSSEGGGGCGGGVLPGEMYDRLEGIYGLGKFNFGGDGAIRGSVATRTASYDDDDDAGSTSSLFDDILSGGRSNRDDGASTSGASGGGFDLNSIPPFNRFRVLHVDPMVLAIDDFFTSDECDAYVRMSVDSEREDDIDDIDDIDGRSRPRPAMIGRSRTVGKDTRSRAQRTSTTWFHHYAGVPELVAKASRLLGLDDPDDIRRWEEPQTVRYRRGEKFSWHLDALSPEEASSAVGAGQRVATLLVYLTDVPSGDGGATMFRDLGGDDGPLRVRPAKGTALLFFPAAGGIPNAPFDIRTLHCGEAVAKDAECEKWIAQLWLRQRAYKPTAPVGNEHRKAFDAIGKYCVMAKRI